MSRIVVDLEAARLSCCGFSQFAISLGNALPAACRSDLALSYLVWPATESYFPSAEVDFIPARVWRREQFVRHLRPLLNGFYREIRCDAWHMSNQFGRFLPVDPAVPVILTIHDLNFLREFDGPRIAQELQKLQKKVDRATVVTAISDFVRSEIRATLDVRDKEVTVIHNGASIATPMATRPDFLPAAPILFSIGEVQRRKNLHVLLDLVARLPEYVLVIAGNKSSDYARGIEAQVREKGLTERVFLPGQISEGERLWLYQNCEALLFPSRTEGFGLPVIEAMSAGRPVFMSHATSLPEVGGPLGFYWHSFDIDHMCEVFYQGMRVFRATPDYGDRLKRHAAQFTWQQTAAKYAALYRSIAAGSSARRQAA